MSSPPDLKPVKEAVEARVGIHQPHYLPWLRYFEKIACSDVFIVLDDVQYEKNGFQNRNKIKTPQGWAYLTVPVQKPLQRPIREILIDNSAPWRDKHLRALELSYRRAPYFGLYWEGLESLYATRWERLADLNDAMLRWFLQILGIGTRLVASSELGIDSSSTARLAELCRTVGGGSYLSGAYALDEYLDASVFQRAGLDLVLQDWRAPEYPQQFPAAGFIRDLSIVDLLFNVGPGSLELLRRSGGLRLASPVGGGDA